MATPNTTPLEVIVASSVPVNVGAKDLVIDKEAQADFQRVLYKAHLDIDSGAIDRVVFVTDAKAYGWTLTTTRPIQFKVAEGAQIAPAVLSQAQGRFRNAEPGMVAEIVGAWKTRVHVDAAIESVESSTARSARP